MSGMPVGDTRTYARIGEFAGLRAAGGGSSGTHLPDQRSSSDVHGRWEGCRVTTSSCPHRVALSHRLYRPRTYDRARPRSRRRRRCGFPISPPTATLVFVRALSIAAKTIARLLMLSVHTVCGTRPRSTDSTNSEITPATSSGSPSPFPRIGTGRKVEQRSPRFRPVTS
jgi:hypothetical protein